MKGIMSDHTETKKPTETRGLHPAVHLPAGRQVADSRVVREFPDAAQRRGHKACRADDTIPD